MRGYARQSVAWVFLGCSIGCATASVESRTAAPEALAPPEAAAGLEVPEGHARLATLRARGVQIYRCAPAAQGGGLEWHFEAPEADLFDAAGVLAGRHFKGPTWAWDDGSEVVGEVVDKRQPTAGNIPWLLLKVKAAKLTSPYGEVAFIQRMDTQGGLAPREGCDAARTGAEVRVPYTATYVFWGRGRRW